jgi:hypothetical protein
MTSNPFDPEVVRKQQIANLIRMADQQNQINRERYEGQSKNWVEVNMRNRELGLPLSPLPIVPKLITVDANGEWWETPQSLPMPTLPPPVPPQTGGSLRPPAGTPLPPDRLDQVIAYLSYQEGLLKMVLERIDAIAIKLKIIGG